MNDFAKVCKDQLGDNLKCLVQTKLPAQYVIVVEKLDFVVTDLIRDLIREREELPLVLSTKELERANDVFSIEFLSIQAQYRVLYGDDLFKDIAFSLDHVRHQLEFELRCKTIVLREKYLQSKDPSQIVQATLPTLVPIFRALVYLKEGKVPATFAELPSMVTKLYSPSTDIHENWQKWKKMDPQKVVEGVMHLLQELGDHVDEV